MSIEEAFSLRDQFGWTPAPDNGRFFVTPVSNGEEDGSIGRDVSNKMYVSRINFNLTTRVTGDTNDVFDSSLRSTYLTYVNKLKSIYGVGKVDSDDNVETIIWYLPSRASVDLGITKKFISATIESPEMTDLTEAEEKYFAEGGEF
ncbi:Uncharacterised protein [Actinomyces viscosus]|uniref:Uncharacterized protein n=2 Tax=Actinomyces viscosus TaxID=1656 RepID=A0A3S4VBC1_ACTVI|nr:Uncharacterised protein [Actinomyces viscosus]